MKKTANAKGIGWMIMMILLLRLTSMEMESWIIPSLRK